MSRRNGYPLDLGQGLDYTRYQGNPPIKPYPEMIGHVSGLLRLFDVTPINFERPIQWGGGTAILKYPQAQQVMNFGQVSFPNLPKSKG